MLCAKDGGCIVAKAIKERKLPHMQWLFAQEFIVDFNGKQAAIRAGYSVRSAEATASRLLRVDKVGAEIAEAQRLRARAAEITVERILEECRRLAFAQT